MKIQLMGEEVKFGNYDGVSASGEDEDRMVEWMDGLPNADDLTPLFQSLIPPELASAFRISPGPFRTMIDVNRASKMTFSSLQGGQLQTMSSTNNFKPFDEEGNMVTDDDDTDLTREGSDSRKTRRIDSGGAGAEEADSALRNENCGDDSSAKSLKRPRLVWTPQLHKRFLDVVGHLGISKAVPKTIMQLMNVEGLTRENVASHLQKYRLYLKRMQSNEGPSPSDHLFASTPVPPQHSMHESGGSGHGQSHSHNHNSSNGHMAMPYPNQMMPMPMFGITAHGYNGHVGEPNGFHHQYYMGQQKAWPGNKFGAYHHVAPTGK